MEKGADVGIPIDIPPQGHAPQNVMVPTDKYAEVILRILYIRYQVIHWRQFLSDKDIFSKLIGCIWFVFIGIDIFKNKYIIYIKLNTHTYIHTHTHIYPSTHPPTHTHTHTYTHTHIYILTSSHL